MACGGVCMSPAPLKRFTAVWYYYIIVIIYYYFFLLALYIKIKYYDVDLVVKTYYTHASYSSFQTHSKGNIGIAAACFIPIISFLWLWYCFSNITVRSRSRGSRRFSVRHPHIFIFLLPPPRFETLIIVNGNKTV